MSYHRWKIKSSWASLYFSSFFFSPRQSNELNVTRWKDEARWKNCRKLCQMTEGGKYMCTQTKRRKYINAQVIPMHTDERVSETQCGEPDSTLKHQYLQYTIFFPPNHKKWSFHAGARSSHTHKRTRPPVIRNRIEIETNEHTKANISSNGGSSSRKKNPIGKFVWGKLCSCHVIEVHRLKTRASHLYSI